MNVQKDIDTVVVFGRGKRPRASTVVQVDQRGFLRIPKPVRLALGLLDADGGKSGLISLSMNVLQIYGNVSLREASGQKEKSEGNAV